MAYDGSTWNEGAPVNSDLAADMDDYIRDVKIGVRSRMANEHKWSASQTATGSDGYHTFVSLSTQTAQPGLVYGTATQAAAIYAISSGTGVSMVARNSAGYEMTLGHSAYLGGGIVPKGGIIMWSGTIAAIPFGWALCDGSSGTPDLRDRFVVGAKQDDGGVAKSNITGSLAQTGGSTTIDLTQIPAHTHSAANQTTSVYGVNAGGVAKPDTGAGNTGSAGGGLPYTQPFYALAFIQKL